MRQLIHDKYPNEEYPDKDNKTFCVLPFVHFHVDTDSTYKPCCVSDRGPASVMGDVNKNTLEEIFNSEKMKQFRLDLLNGVKRPEICSTCYKAEDSNFISYRTGMNDQLKRHIKPAIEAVQPDGYMDPKLKSWDIRFSNLCNLKCRTCGPTYSTTHAKESKYHVGMLFDDLIAFDSSRDPLESQYEHVENIYFAGGEPMIMPEHYNTLKKLIEIDKAKEVILYYNSNMTKLEYNKNYMPDYWKEFESVSLGMSIDAFGERANYIRNGSVKWNKIEENIVKLQNYDNIHYFIGPALSLLNAHHLTDMHKYFVENSLIKSVDNINLNIVFEPPYYSVKLLSPKLKKEIQEKVKQHFVWLEEQGANEVTHERFQTFYEYLSESFDKEMEDKLLNNFIWYTAKQDSYRNEHFPDTFPEYKEWWEEITAGKTINLLQFKEIN